MFEVLPLGVLVEKQQGGGTPPRNEPSFWYGDIPWASVKDFKDDQLELLATEETITSLGLRSSTSSLVPPGTPMVCTRMAVGRCAVSPTPTAINQDIRALYPKKGVDPRYLLRVIASLRGKAESLSVGSTVKGIRSSDFLAIKAHIAPEKEQGTITRILDTLDTQIQKTEALIAKLEKVKEGLLHDLLTRGIDENGQLRPSPEQAPELYKDSPLGLIPKGWGVGSLGDLSEIVSGVTLGGKSGSSAWPLVPYLRVANVQDGYLDLSEVKLIRVSSVDLEKYRLLPGDVLMNEGGDFDKLGRGALWQGQIGLCIHQNHVFRVRTTQSVLNPHFLTAFSSSAIGKRYFIRSSKQSTNLASINSTQLKAFQVSLPSNTEQELIVKELQAMASKIESEKALLDKLIIQKSGLMNDLLTGHVRVTSLLDQAQTPTPA
ncbi:restriction endonuclease subunit S [Ectothiorhodospira lacustris]|uniref:restriction endonuclease subunit S n=1 Tax=Ectothiorhodospira lacustris TaxID=2899127 RepID=UPI001EE798D4|nr:restriction endonuclease subunit S [Ectothiorhodospira lacustris]MCG5502051.1 restriction endonuclease subunit S [Ectothiorhodospira lacustris]